MAKEWNGMKVVAITGDDCYAALNLLSSLLGRQGKNCMASNHCQSIKAVTDAINYNQSQFRPQILLVTTKSAAVVKHAHATFDANSIDPRKFGIVLQQWVNDFVDSLNRETE